MALVTPTEKCFLLTPFRNIGIFSQKFRNYLVYYVLDKHVFKFWQFIPMWFLKIRNICICTRFLDNNLQSFSLNNLEPDALKTINDKTLMTDDKIFLGNPSVTDSFTEFWQIIFSKYVCINAHIYCFCSYCWKKLFFTGTIKNIFKVYYGWRPPKLVSVVIDTDKIINRFTSAKRKLSFIT